MPERALRYAGTHQTFTPSATSSSNAGCIEALRFTTVVPGLKAPQ